MDNSSFHSDCHRPMDDECAYLDHTLERHSDAMEWMVHSIRSISYDCHSELLMWMASMESHPIDHHHTEHGAVLLCHSNPRACPYAIAVLPAIHCHVDRMPSELLPIYCPANKVSNLNALMAVGMHSTNHCSIQYFPFYLQPIMVSEMIWKSSLWQHD